MHMNLVHTMQLAFLMHEDRVREFLGTKPIPPGGPANIYVQRHDDMDTPETTPRATAPPTAPWVGWWAWWPRSSEG